MKVGIVAAAQQYASNYFSTGSGFRMPGASSGPVIVYAESGAAAAGGASLWHAFLQALRRAPEPPQVQVKFDEPDNNRLNEDKYRDQVRAAVNTAAEYLGISDIKTIIVTVTPGGGGSEVAVGYYYPPCAVAT
jgi:hypothetical protein